MNGTLFAVGVGPGDPELLTLKAVRLLQSGAVIAYPVGADSQTGFARNIAAPHMPETVEEYGFTVPMRVDRKPASDAYDAAARDLAEILSQGKNVVLLCEGDPLFYGSAMYLIDRLISRFACEVVPGITSVTACAASIIRPLVARNERLTILPAPLDEEILERDIKNAEAVAIMKVGRHFEKVRGVLEKLHLAEKAIIVERATGETEKISRLYDIPAGERPYFSTILVYQGQENWGTNND